MSHISFDAAGAAGAGSDGVGNGGGVVNGFLKRKVGRPRKHNEKLVPVTAYVKPKIREILDAMDVKFGEWVADAIERKLMVEGKM